MTRHDLEQAICDLQYLILNHFDPDRIEHYSERLQQLRSQLRALQQSQASAAAAAASVPRSRKASSNSH
jgi:hypothetical protein